MLKAGVGFGFGTLYLSEIIVLGDRCATAIGKDAQRNKQARSNREARGE